MTLPTIHLNGTSRKDLEEGGRMIRQFKVLVLRETPRRKPKWLAYPPHDGAQALACMETLSGRGHKVMAETTGNGIQETLTLAEMRGVVL